MANEVINRKELTISKEAEVYAKKLEELYVDIKTTPHFEDEEVMLEDWSVEWFHKETKDEIEWTVVVALMIYINQTGNQVSHCLTNEDFKNFAYGMEQHILGKSFVMVNDLTSLDGITIVSENES